MREAASIIEFVHVALEWIAEKLLIRKRVTRNRYEADGDEQAANETELPKLIKTKRKQDGTDT